MPDSGRPRNPRAPSDPAVRWPAAQVASRPNTITATRPWGAVVEFDATERYCSTTILPVATWLPPIAR